VIDNYRLWQKSWILLLILKLNKILYLWTTLPLTTFTKKFYKKYKFPSTNEWYWTAHNINKTWEINFLQFRKRFFTISTRHIQYLLGDNFFNYNVEKCYKLRPTVFSDYNTHRNYTWKHFLIKFFKTANHEFKNIQHISALSMLAFL